MNPERSSDAVEVASSGLILEEAGWSDMLDRILRGLCHDLNSRVSSLMAAIQLIELGEPLPDEFRDETSKLEAVAIFLQTLPANLEAAPAAVLPRDLVSRALAWHTKVRDVGYDRPPSVSEIGEPPAILVGEDRVVRGLTLLIDQCALEWDRLTSPLEITGDGHSATLMIPSVEPLVPGVRFGRLEALFALDGGILTVSAKGAALTFPSLMAARAGSGRA